MFGVGDIEIDRVDVIFVFLLVFDISNKEERGL